MSNPLKNHSKGSMSDGLGLIQHNPDHVRPLKAWAREIAIRKESHRELANHYSTFDKIINGIAVTLSAFSSSAIFASYKATPVEETNHIINFQLIGGIIAVTSTILQSLQKALQFAELAEQHKNACKQFTKLRFRLEIIAGENLEDDGTLNMDRLTDWTREYQDLLESSPLIHIAMLKKQANAYKTKVALEKEIQLIEDEPVAVSVNVGSKED